jgi:uncharacterized DUF497 family protein
MIYIKALDWDEDTEEHIARHGVTIDEVEEAINSILYAKRSRKYLLTLAQTESGRHLAVVLDALGKGVWKVVTARPVNNSERWLINKRKTRRK